MSEMPSEASWMARSVFSITLSRPPLKSLKTWLVVTLLRKVHLLLLFDFVSAMWMFAKRTIRCMYFECCNRFGF